jgi:TonB-linked SusC/RagA family outer membrane protein
MKLLPFRKSPVREGRLLPKMLLIMKLTAFLFLIATLQIHAGTFSQSVTIKGKNLSLENIFNKIKQQTGYDFVYDSKLLKKIPTVDLYVQDEQLSRVLDECLKNQPFTYEINYNIIVIIEKPAPVLNAEQPIPPVKKITGVIKDENGIPLPGVTITIKRLSKITITNQNGEFVFNNLQSGTYKIGISSIGYKDIETEVTVTNDQNAVLNLVLYKEVKELEETVVVGYGVQKKVNLTGSVATVKGTEFESRPIGNAIAGLQGLLPGVEITSASGQPGSAATSIRIRGMNTLYSNNDPLILIDGVQGDMSMLNPDDIESVTVLKDAASSAIYGARAATGVLLVTTKKGLAGKKMTINYSGYASLQKPTTLPELVNGRQYMTLYNEALVNAGLAKLFLDSAFIKYDAKSAPNDYSNTNWINEIYKKYSTQQNHNISLDGGDSKTGYHLSYGHLSQNGLIVGDPYSSYRHNFRLRANTELFNRLNIDAILSYSNYYRQDAAASGTAGVFRLAQRISPLLPVKYLFQDASGNWTPTDYYSVGSVSNPVNAANNSGSYHYASNIPSANISASLLLMKGLQLKAQYAFTGTFGQSKTFGNIIKRYYPDGTEYAADTSLKNSVSSSFSTEIYQSYSNTLNYEKSFSKHNITALAGYSQELDETYSESAYRQSVLLDGIEVINAGTANIQNSGTETHWALQSYFGRINYNYAEKYLLEANIRRDGTSRFASAHRWGTFPSFSAGWNILKENFMQFSKPVLQQLKVRASYGTLGNQNVGNLYPYLTPITSYSNAYPIGLTNNVGYSQSSIGNADLLWETVEVTNLGIDAQLLQNRLYLTFDWFIKNNKNALVKPTYPSTIGSTSPSALPFANMGKVQSKGWELNISWKDKIGQVNYGLNFMLSDVTNTVKSLGKMAPVIGDNIFRVGDPVNAYYGYKTNGLAQTTDFGGYNVTTGKYTNPNFPTVSSYSAIVQPGDIKYKDLNGDGKITTDSDRTVIGTTYPRYTYSLRGNIAWKNFDASFFLQGIAKVNGYLYAEAIHAFINDYSTPQKTHMDRWTPANTSASYPRLYYGETHNSLFSDYWIQNAAFLRVKNIQFGYTLRMKLSSSTVIEKMRFYISGENLFTITKYFYAYDPEIKSSSGDSYPQVKTYALGVSLTLR